MLFKNIKVKGRLIQILIERPFFWKPRAGKYPEGRKWFVFKRYAWGHLELRRFYTQKEQNEWVANKWVADDELKD